MPSLPLFHTACPQQLLIPHPEMVPSRTESIALFGRAPGNYK